MSSAPLGLSLGRSHRTAEVFTGCDAEKTNRPPGRKAPHTPVRTRGKDMERSVRFYTEVLGMKLRGRAKNRSIRGEWAQLESPGTHQVLELNWYSRTSPLYGPWKRGVEMDHLCFRVDDLDDAVKALKEAGAKRLGGPYLTPGWKMVDVSDPNGICIELGAPTRSRRSQRR